MNASDSSSSHALPSKRTVFLRFLLSLLPLIVFIWILRRIDLPLLPSRKALSTVHVWGVAGYVLWYLLVLYVRGGRWVYLVRAFAPINRRTAFDLTSIGNAAIVIMPMRSGEVIRPLLAKRRGLSSITIFSTIGAERIIDGLSVGLIVFVSLSLAPGHPGGLEILPQQFRDPSLVTRAARFAFAGFSLALAGLFVFYFNEAKIKELILGTVGKISLQVANRLNGLLSRIAAGLSFLKDRRAATAYLLSTVLFWSLQLIGVYGLLLACGMTDVRFIESCAITGVFALGFLLPSPPGFFGAFQTTFYAGFLLYFPTARVVTEGACVVFFAYVIQLGVTVLLGIFCYLREFTWGALPSSRSAT